MSQRTKDWPPILYQKSIIENEDMLNKLIIKKIKPSVTAEVEAISQKLLRLESQLSSNIPTTLWISDLHGEGDRFKSILRGRFGLLYQTCKEALPKTFSDEKVQYLARVIRKHHFFKDDTIKMDIQDILLCLTQVIRYKLSNIHYKVEDVILPEFREYIVRMISGMPVPDKLFEEEIISNRLVYHLSHTIQQILLDGIVVLGDIFDRGPQPDKIIRILASRHYHHLVRYVYGNHDILWVGAVSGNPSLVAETLRVTCRYDHFELLKRLGLDTSKLEEFAGKTYPIDKITGNFKAKTDRAKSMEKALSIIQFKLEEKTIRNHPEYKMEDRLWLEKLSNLLQAKTTDNLLDTHFPTLDPKNPARLTDQENEIISDLTHQFVTNRHLKRLLNFFFDKGETYHIHNNILNIHALIPSTENGDFDKFLGKKGKELLDWIQATIDRIGLAYLNNQPQKEADQSLMFYLWCGPKSPFFGKVAMKTFERYFIKDKKTHLEPSLFWNQNLKTKRFKDKIMNEFGTKRVIYGHTPVDVTKGKTMASEDGVAINIDGGFAAAYYNRGHALVHTPHQLYGIILPTPDEVEKAKLTSETVPLSVELIDEFSEPIKIKDTFKGRKMTKEADELLEKLRRLQHKYLSQPHHH